MDWLTTVQARHKRGNALLFSKADPYLHDLSTQLAQQTHRAVVLWALELAEATALQLPHEPDLLHAVLTSRAWAAGEVKMREAQRAILQAHAVAKRLSSREDIALCHAVGQACGTVHTAGHAIGYPMYELTALVHCHGLDHCQQPIEQRLQHYSTRLHHWQQAEPSITSPWAPFL